MVCHSLFLFYAVTLLTPPSNQEDLHLISEMGISPDLSVLGRKRTFKAGVLAVIATLRMKRWSESWAGQRKVHAQLVKTLEGMRRRQGRGQVQEQVTRSSVGGARQALSFVR